jgi:hypothetical protein
LLVGEHQEGHVLKGLFLEKLLELLLALAESVFV